MRLTDYDVKCIKRTFKEFFRNGDIYLFGSRVDDAKRGGDIDLYIVNHQTDNLLEKKIAFLAALKQKIGDQKIDLLISKDTKCLIEQEALTKGIKL